MKSAICRNFAKNILLPLLIFAAAFSALAADEVKPLSIIEGGNSQLNLRVKIYSGNEDETFEESRIGKFYVLDRDPLMILKDAGFELSEEGGDITARNASDSFFDSTNKADDIQYEEELLEAAVRLFISLDDKEIYLSPELSAAGEFWKDIEPAETDEEETALLGMLLLPKLKKHMAASFALSEQNSPNGIKLPFRHGEFYLFGYAKHQDEIIVWNLPIKIGASPQIVDLDQYNSAALFSF
ncbi:MAG TPA: hypothetical protein PKY59_23515 [Pyrinomonadaceae bacterium]|nr:hypothetical protein [Pyrinomonadaceae bacterium]